MTGPGTIYLRQRPPATRPGAHIPLENKRHRPMLQSGSQAQGEADAGIPCTPRNVSSHTSTGLRPVVFKAGSGEPLGLNLLKGLIFL